MKETILYHIGQLVTPRGSSLRHGREMGGLTVIRDGAVRIRDGVILAVGTTDQVMETKGQVMGPGGMEDGGPDPSKTEYLDLRGKTVLPGFVDSHTHFVFAGYRPEEFLMRLGGAGYMDIMRMGGGIQSTVDATRTASCGELLRLGRERLDDMLSMGVTTVEGKSGYGLDRGCEIRQLEVMRDLDKSHPVDVVPTYLGAHAVPKEYGGRPEEYLDYMVGQVLPEVKARGLAQFCDVFCEEGVFTLSQSERLLRAARQLGFGLKLHADEIVPLGGGELAARLGAVSADHLLAVSEEGTRMLASSATCATLLPCTAFCLNKPYAPARKMIDAGCGVALASDYNPGSCFTNSVPLMFALAVLVMGMTAAEAICALTLNAAAAVGRAGFIGTLEPGKQADLVVLGCPDYRFLVYHTAKNLVETVIKKGEIVYERSKEKVIQADCGGSV